MQNNRVYSQELIDRVVDEYKITDLEHATIGQVLLLASRLEELTGIPFIRMDQGVPGLEPCRIGTEAEKQALDTDIPAIYPAAEGIPELKEAGSRFVKAFLDVDVSSEACIPVTGSVAGSFGSFVACTQCDPQKNAILFIDPGFPIQKSQLKILGIPHEQFDIYRFRGDKLRDKLESYLKKGNIAGIIYSNPNNPAWISLTEQELSVVGELATRYGAVVLEDLAYFGMDFRTYFGRPFEPPYIPTVAPALYPDRRPIYRQLHSDAFVLENLQLCRTACCPVVCIGYIVPSPLPGFGGTVCRCRYFRTDAHRIDPLYDYFGNHPLHAVRLCRYAAGRNRRAFRFCGSDFGICPPGSPHERTVRKTWIPCGVR